MIVYIPKRRPYLTHSGVHNKEKFTFIAIMKDVEVYGLIGNNRYRPIIGRFADNQCRPIISADYRRFAYNRYRSIVSTFANYWRD